jgi:adenylate cyclase
VLAEYNAEIYQYVGDEIVLSWRITEGMRQLACLRFYFACVRQFEKRKEYYIDRYGMVPFFKAGVHLGPVMAVEIGEIKRDIAYHGDTLNTAARIQGLCNTYQQQLLISNLFCEHEDFERLFVAASLGEVMLKGKKLGVEIFGVGEREV